MWSQGEKELMKMEYTKDNGLSAKALKNLKRNELFRRIELGLMPIPPLKRSTVAVVLDPERIEPVACKVDGKNVIRLRYIVTVSPEHKYDTGERAVIADARTSEAIDAYLRENINIVDIRVSCRGKDIIYKIEPFYQRPKIIDLPVVYDDNITPDAVCDVITEASSKQDI
jgi:hypothetical protein